MTLISKLHFLAVIYFDKKWKNLICAVKLNHFLERPLLKSLKYFFQKIFLGKLLQNIFSFRKRMQRYTPDNLICAIRKKSALFFAKVDFFFCKQVFASSKGISNMSSENSLLLSNSSGFPNQIAFLVTFQGKVDLTENQRKISES